MGDKKIAMWTLASLQHRDNGVNVRIDGMWVPARPVNYTKKHCGLLTRLYYAWYVVTGKAETFVWPKGQ